VTIAVVGELVVGGREFLETLGGDAGEIPSELCVLCKYNVAPSHKAVDQILLPHFFSSDLCDFPPIQQRESERGRERENGREVRKEKEKTLYALALDFLIFEGTHLLISTFFLWFSASVYFGKSENLSHQYFSVFFS